MYKVTYEGIHGELISYITPLEELRAYLLPNWFPIWESNAIGEDTLCMLSPELITKYRTLVSRDGTR